jgi:hypothetical protein
VLGVIAKRGVLTAAALAVLGSIATAEAASASTTTSPQQSALRNSTYSAVGLKPTCASQTWRGTFGYLSVQTSRNGNIAWGVYPNNPLNAFGIWEVDVFINGRRVDHKNQGYPPHGTINVKDAGRGKIATWAGFTIPAQLFGRDIPLFVRGGPHTCLTIGRWG